MTAIRIQPNTCITISVDSSHVFGKHDPIKVYETEIYDFQVYPNQKWSDFYFIKTTARGFNYFFKNRLRVKGAKYLNLCATINCKENYYNMLRGKEKKIKDDIENTFIIGLKKEKYEVNKEGYLSLFANDHLGYYRNNRNSIKVKITRIV